MATDVGEIRLQFDSNAKQITQDLSDFARAARDLTKALKGTKSQAEKIKDAYDGIAESSDDAGESVDELGEDIEDSGNKAKKSEGFFAKLFRSLKRIFLYRAIRKVFSDIAQGAKEGLSNLYQWSSVVGSFDVSNTKDNMDKLSSSALYLKNALGTVLGHTIQLLMPLFNKLTVEIGKALQMVSAFTSALGGEDFYIYAKPDAFAQWGEDIGGATTKAKELRRVLLGFDEVNRLDMETPSASGSGVGDTSSNIDFAKGEISNGVKEFAKAVQEVLPIVELVGKALAAWAIGEALFDAFSKLKFWFAETDKSALKTKLAIAGIAIGTTVAVDGIQGMIDTGGDLKYFAETLGGVGVTALGMGGMFGSTAGLITLAVGTVIASITRCVTVWKESGYTWKDVCEAMGVTISELPNWVKAPLQVVALFFENTFMNISQNLTNFANWVGNIWSSIFPNSKTFHFNWTYEQLPQGTMRYQILNALGLPTQMPRLHIEYYARGGVVSGSSLLGFNGGNAMVGGERGAEAIVPLERNTEWLDRIADRLSQSQGDRPIVINIDGKRVFEVVVDQNNSYVNSRGVSPLKV